MQERDPHFSQYLAAVETFARGLTAAHPRLERIGIEFKLCHIALNELRDRRHFREKRVDVRKAPWTAAELRALPHGDRERPVEAATWACGERITIFATGANTISIPVNI